MTSLNPFELSYMSTIFQNTFYHLRCNFPAESGNILIILITNFFLVLSGSNGIFCKSK